MALNIKFYDVTGQKLRDDVISTIEHARSIGKSDHSSLCGHLVDRLNELYGRRWDCFVGDFTGLFAFYDIADFELDGVRWRVPQTEQ